MTEKNLRTIFDDLFLIIDEVIEDSDVEGISLSKSVLENYNKFSKAIAKLDLSESEKDIDIVKNTILIFFKKHREVILDSKEDEWLNDKNENAVCFVIGKSSDSKLKLDLGYFYSEAISSGVRHKTSTNSLSVQSKYAPKILLYVYELMSLYISESDIKLLTPKINKLKKELKIKIDNEPATGEASIPNFEAGLKNILGIAQSALPTISQFSQQWGGPPIDIEKTKEFIGNISNNKSTNDLIAKLTSAGSQALSTGDVTIFTNGFSEIMNSPEARNLSSQVSSSFSHLYQGNGNQNEASSSHEEDDGPIVEDITNNEQALVVRMNDVNIEGFTAVEEEVEECGSGDEICMARPSN